MSNLSRKEAVALAAVTMIFVCALGWTLVRMAQSSTLPGVTLREAFPQPPGGIPPGSPIVAANAPPAVSAPPEASGQGAPVPSSPAASQNTVQNTVERETPGVAPPSSEVVVHVAGAVHTPGVYHLPVGARNEEALKKAGGPTAEANTDGINLAARVEDGTQLYLPTRKQHPEGGADAPTNAPDTDSSPAFTAGSKASGKAVAKGVTKAASGAKGSGKSGKLSDPAQGKVNINTASVEELQRLPGIGPAMAERISEFRKQGGKFAAPEDLLQISGIGEKKFARMQPFVKVR